MADDDKERQALAATQTRTEEQLREAEDEEKKLFLDQGRSVAVNRDGAHQVVEFRDASGTLELRVKLTEEGPVLVMEGMKVQVNAAESFTVKCKDFNVEAEGETLIASKGEMRITSEGEMNIASPEDIRVKGKIIWLN
jgi:hypothetical protein